MAFPDGLTLITVTGQLAGLPDGTSGLVTFRWPWLQGPDGEILAGGELTVMADSEGEFTAAVPATNDPAWSPTGWTMRVTVLRGTKAARGTVTLPYDGGAVELADVFNADDAVEPGVTYALSNHTHPGGGGGGSTAWADVTGKPSTFPPTIGSTSSTAAAGNHTHAWADVTGKPSTFPPTIGSTSTTAAAGNHTHPDLATDVELAALDARVVDLEEAPGGGGGSTLAVKQAVNSTAGAVVPQAAASWAAVTGGPTISLAAAVDDYISLDVLGALVKSTSSTFLELAVLVGGVPVRYGSSGTNTPSTEGDPAFYSDFNFRTAGVGFGFKVTSGDLSGGVVTFGWAVKGAGTGATIYASADYPLRWRIMNYGPATVS